jgi:hypothetical protein
MVEGSGWWREEVVGVAGSRKGNGGTFSRKLKGGGAVCVVRHKPSSFAFSSPKLGKIDFPGRLVPCVTHW